MSVSKLESPRDRYLSLCLSYALDEGWLTAADLNSEFNAETLMTALEPAGNLRARLLVEAAGVHERIAPKKSTTAAAEDLQIALDEGICSPTTILQVITVDDHVRYLEASDLWALLTRDQFWKQSGARAQGRMLQMIRAGLDESLLDLHRLVRAVTPEQLASDLPRELLESALSTAIHAGLDGCSFEPKTLLESLALESWLEHLPLTHFWDAVILNEVATSAGLGSGSVAAGGPAARKQQVDDVSPAKKGRNKKTSDETAPASSPSTDSELIARERAIKNLSAIDRLPKDSQNLRSPVLLGLDSMYEDLLLTETDEDRAERIRDAFPNPAMLTEALYAMAETLDPRLTQEALRARGADSNAIIQLILFEERRRAAKANGILSASPPPVSNSPGSVPPPSPTVGTRGAAAGVPPLPPQAARRSAPPPPLPAQARTNSGTN